MISPKKRNCWTPSTTEDSTATPLIDVLKLPSMVNVPLLVLNSIPAIPPQAVPLSEKRASKAAVKTALFNFRIILIVSSCCLHLLWKRVFRKA